MVDVKQETFISVTILTVVTVVVIGVWTKGFGLFKNSFLSTSQEQLLTAWGGNVGPNRLRPFDSAAVPINAAPGLTTVAKPLPVAVPVETPFEAETQIAPNYIPENLQLFEAHWQGMDARALTSELRRKLRYPVGLEGVLLGEVTLAAGRAGLLGGDVITAVEGQAITNLNEFQEATRTVAGRKQATLSVLRKTKDRNGDRFAAVRMNVLLVSDRELGFAQAEAAPMIKPGDPRPHSDRGPCTQCHAVGVGFELRPDPDLITLPPTPISRDVAVKRTRPHEERGPCEACHVISP
ncbi:Multi-heme protein MamP [Azospirillaceae bacterium]